MQEITMPIDEVTLLEDRAQVQRKAAIELPAGVNRLRLPGVTPLAIDKSLVGSVLGQARVVDVRIERWLPEAQPQQQQTTVDEAERRRLQRRLRAVDKELEAASNLRLQTLQEVVCQVTRGNHQRQQWDDQLQELEEWSAELLQQKLDLEAELLQLQLDRPRPVPGEKAPSQQAAVTLEVEVAEAGEVQLSVEYSVPAACWRPYHTAVLDEKNQTLEFRCEGCVWQNTLEDWNDVKLVFSTQRPSLGIDPPELGSDTLRSQKKDSTLVVAARDQEVEKVTPQSMAAAEVPGIDDGGELVLLRARGRCTVPSNGQPVRARVFSFTAPAALERVLIGELENSVMLKTVQENAGAYPLLAGPVDMVRDSGLVGRGQILYCAPSEEFTLGWGPDAALRSRRRQSHTEEKRANVLSGWYEVEHCVEVKLSNLSTTPSSVEVLERIPVSELKEIEIVCQHQADANGFVRRQVELGPLGRQTLELRYTVRRRREVSGLQHAGELVAHG